MTNDVFAAFPDIWEWIQKSQDVMGTQAAWRETLRQCRLDECLFVLGEWISGAIEAPKAYERGHTALLLKSRVMRIRDDEARKRQSSQTGDVYEHAKRKRDHLGLRETIPELREAYVQILPWNDKLKAGEITEDERLEKIKELTESICNRVQGVI